MKKTWNIIRKIIVWMIVVFSLGMMAFTIVSVTTFDRADRSLFGYSAFIVLSDSMKATDFDAGDLVLIKKTDPSTLKEGDIISFQSPDESNYGEIVTHKIRKVTTDEDGNPGFVTYGTTTDSNDRGIVTYNLVIGKYQCHIPNVGAFFQFLKTVPGYFICIFTPFFILILVQVRNSVKLFRKYKREQMEEIQQEKKALEEERLKSQQMMEQLARMQQQMQQSGVQLTPEYLAQMKQAQAAETVSDIPPQPSSQSGHATPEIRVQQTAVPQQPQAAAGIPAHQASQQRPAAPQNMTAPATAQSSAAQGTAQRPVQAAPSETAAHVRTEALQPQRQRSAAAHPEAAVRQAAPQQRPMQQAPRSTDVRTAAPQRPAVQQQNPAKPQTRAAATPDTAKQPQPSGTAKPHTGFDIRSIVGEADDLPGQHEGK